MSARPAGGGLRLLVVGVVFGAFIGAILRPRKTPEAVGKNFRNDDYKDSPKKAKSAFTNNAVIAGVVSAVVAGIIAFLVAHYQIQEAGSQGTSQADASQQVAISEQVETEASKLYYHALDYNVTEDNCGHGDKDSCKQITSSATGSLFSDLFPLQNTEHNVSDATTLQLIDALTNDVFNTVYPGAGIDVTGSYGAAIEDIGVQLDDDYNSLMKRCGEIIQGK